MSFPKDWYFVVSEVGANSVYSTARHQYVPLDDAQYVAWQEKDETHNAPTLATEDELGEFLGRYSLRPNRPKALLAYRKKHAKLLSLPIMLKLFAWLINKARENDSPQPRAISNKAQFQQFLIDEGIV